MDEMGLLGSGNQLWLPRAHFFRRAGKRKRGFRVRDPSQEACDTKRVEAFPRRMGAHEWERCRDFLLVTRSRASEWLGGMSFGLVYSVSPTRQVMPLLGTVRTLRRVTKQVKTATDTIRFHHVCEVPHLVAMAMTAAGGNGRSPLGT